MKLLQNENGFNMITKFAFYEGPGGDSTKTETRTAQQERADELQKKKKVAEKSEERKEAVNQVLNKNAKPKTIQMTGSSTFPTFEERLANYESTNPEQGEDENEEKTE